MNAPGRDEYQTWLDAGFSQTEADAEITRQKTDQQKAGFSASEISDYWGETPPDLRVPAKDFLDRAATATGDHNAEKIANDPLSWFEAGWGQSVTGLMLGKPDTVLPQDAGTFAKLIAGAGGIAGDWPYIVAGMAGGAAVGGVAGGALGSEVPVVGNVAGAAAGTIAGGWYGSGFLPGYMRKALMARYQNGDVHTWNDFWGNIGSAIMGGNREGLPNVIAGPIGGAIGGKVLGATNSALLSTTANLTAQATTMTAVGGALDKHVPGWDDFVAATLLVGGLHMAGTVVGAAPNARVQLNEAGTLVAKRLMDLYAKTGMHPEEALHQAEQDPTFKAEILGDTPNEPEIDGKTEGERFQERWAEQDQQWNGVIKEGNLDNTNIIKFDEYARKKAQEAQDLDLIPDTVSPRDADTANDISEPMPDEAQGIAGGFKSKADDFLDRMAGSVLRQEGGKLVPEGPSIASYLHNFGRKAGFNFVVGDEETSPAAGRASPHYMPKSRTVFIPDTQEELNKRWYGLGRYEIIYHEVGHAIDYGLGKLYKTAFGEGETAGTTNPLRMEIAAVSKEFKPKIWDVAPGHAMKDSELMADGIAVWISNPTARAKMPEFGKKYGKILEPYVKIAARNLPKRTEQGWQDQVPPDQAPSGAAGGGGRFTPPGGGRNEPPGDEVFPPENPGISPKITDKSLKMSPEHQIEDFMEGRVGERPKNGWRNIFNPRYLYRQYVSELGAGRTFDIEQGIGQEKLGVEDMLRQTYASAPRARYFMKYGGLDPITMESIDTPSYEAAWKVVAEKGGTMAGFEGYRIAKRTIELADRGIKSGFDVEKAQAIVNRKENKARYSEAEKMVNQAKNGSIDYARDSGLFSKAGAQAIKDLNTSHITLKRISDPGYNPSYLGKTRGFNTKMPVKKIQGSDRMVLSPTITDIENLHHIIAMADRNRAVGAIVGKIEEINTNLEAAGMPTKTTMKMIENAEKPRAEVLDEDGNVIYDSRHPPKKPGEAQALDNLAIWKSVDTHQNPGQFIYYRDGVAERWETNDPELARILRAPGDASEAHAAVHIMTQFAKFARLGVIADPGFPARSILRGEFSTAINMPHGGLPFSNFFTGIMHVMKETPEFKEAMANGATGGSFMGLDARPLVEDINGLFQRTRVYKNAWNFFDHPLEAIQRLQEKLYSAQTVGYYIRTRNLYESNLKAGTEARKSSIDISEKAGLAAVNTWHRSTLFLRTSVLDIAQFGRALRERPLSTMFKISTLLVVPTAVTWAANQVFDSRYENDPEYRRANPGYVPYRELPYWERVNSFVLPPIGGVRIRLPFKPYTSGFFSALVEQGLDALVLKDPKAFTVERAWQSFEGLVIPGFIPSIVLPIYEIFANTRTVSKTPLVSDTLEKASGYMRYTKDTTEAAKAIARWISPDVGLLSKVDMGLNIAPIWIDNLVRGWAGPVPVEIMKAAEVPFHIRSHPWDIGDIPIVKAFVARHPGASAQSIQNFYDDAKKVEMKGTDWFLAVRRMNMGEVQEQAGDPRRGMIAYVGETKKALSGMQAAIDGINTSKKLNNDEKLKQIDAIYSSMIVVSRNASRVINSVHR